jgi:hypothetical protein
LALAPSERAHDQPSAGWQIARDTKLPDYDGALRGEVLRDDDDGLRRDRVVALVFSSGEGMRQFIETYRVRCGVFIEIVFWRFTTCAA